MPANRSRTLHWRRCLEQIYERNGAIEIAVDRSDRQSEGGRHLVWRVRILQLAETEIVVEQPMTLGQVIPLRDGVALVGVLAVGQNRWMFQTENLGRTKVQLNAQRSIAALRLRMPQIVERCQRRNYYRVQTSGLQLPEIELWPLLDPKSVVLAERANEVWFEHAQCKDNDPASPDDVAALTEEDVMPEVGPRFNALLLNLGGGGAGVRVAPDNAQALARHKLFWMRFALPPELAAPICATTKLAHTHVQSDQHVYAGMAFDFSFNPGHQRFVVDQICRYIAVQQRLQLQRQMLDEEKRRIA